MTSNQADHPSEGVRLLPHQTGLVEQIAGGTEPNVIVLEAEVGLGKSVALAAAIARVISAEPTARVLLLVQRRVLGEQFVSLLDNLNAPAAIVDRYRFREMLDATPGHAVWPDGRVSVLGWDLAVQDDVAATLKSTPWTMVVVDESHVAAQQRRELLRSLSHVTNRLVLATASVYGYDFGKILGQGRGVIAGSFAQDGAIDAARLERSNRDQAADGARH